jgi:hypothetical protein
VINVKEKEDIKKVMNYNLIFLSALKMDKFLEKNSVEIEAMLEETMEIYLSKSKLLNTLNLLGQIKIFSL